MKTAIVAAFALSLTAPAALAQTSSGSSTSGGASTSGTTTSPGGSVGRGAPALAPRTSGPVTPNRSNSEVFPPSRLLPPTGGSVTTQQGQASGSTSTGTPSAAGTSATGQPTTTGGSTATQGGTNTTTPDASTSAGQGVSTSGTQNSDGSAAANSGQSGGGGTSGSIRPIPPNSQTSSGSAQTPGTRTGKNALNETITDCMKLWEPATHMTKADWLRTCRRVQGRLDQVTKQVLGSSESRENRTR